MHTCETPVLKTIIPQLEALKSMTYFKVWAVLLHESCDIYVNTVMIRIKNTKWGL